MNDKLTVADAVEAVAAVPLTNGKAKKDTATDPPLPVALRNEDISEADFEALCRIAENLEAPTGRLQRVPRKIQVGDGKENTPSVETVLP